MRKSIFELMDTEIDYLDEIKKFELLFAKTTYFTRGNNRVTMERYIDTFHFKNWPFRNRFININELREELGILDPISIQNITLQNFLTYIEFIANMVDLLKFNGTKEMEIDMNVINKNIDLILAKLNFEIKQIDQHRLIIVEKNAAATAVADIVEKELANKVIEYNHFLLKGNIIRKSEILLTLSLKFEGIEKVLKGTEFKALAEQIGYLLNILHLRHNNKEGKNANNHIKSMNDKDLEHWYDRTYDFLLLSFLGNDYSNYKAEIEDLKKMTSQ